MMDFFAGAILMAVGIVFGMYFGTTALHDSIVKDCLLLGQFRKSTVVFECKEKK